MRASELLQMVIHESLRAAVAKSDIHGGGKSPCIEGDFKCFKIPSNTVDFDFSGGGGKSLPHLGEFPQPRWGFSLSVWFS